LIYKIIQSSVNYNKGLCLLTDGCGGWLPERCLLVPTFDQQHPLFPIFHKIKIKKDKQNIHTPQRG